MFKYDFEKLKAAITFNTAEVLPTDEKQLDEEIKFLIEKANTSGEKIRHYIGFEISGQIHFPGSVYMMMNVAKLQEAGVECVLWLADYHTWINRKLDGNIETIRKVAQEYFIPVFKKSLEIVGGKPEELGILMAKDEYSRKNEDDLMFWDHEIEVEKNITLSRITRSLSIAGKEAGESTDYMVTRYPGMQAADIFWLNAHIAHGGLDQRKIYVLARDNAKNLEYPFQLKIGKKPIKPIVIFNNLLLGLEPPKTGADFETAKMSKSKPDGAIWVHDSLEEITRKLKKAYCPMPQKDQSEEEIELEQELNPMLDWAKKMIFPGGKRIEISRPEKFGGDVSYGSFKDLQADYFAGKLHPLDLKNGIATTLAKWFKPIKEWGDQNQEIIEYVKKSKK
jgi:tyrosyl-tRNA synthetase